MLHLKSLSCITPKFYHFSNFVKGCSRSTLTFQYFLQDISKKTIKNLSSSNRKAFSSSFTSVSNNYMSNYSETGEKIMINNPSEIKVKKALTDVFVKPRMTVEEFRKALATISDEEFNSSLRGMAIPNDSNYILKNDEMEILALQFDHIIVTKRPSREEIPLRSPIMTIMGHVDHGKTTLLDSLRNSNIAEGEYGKITQKIGAFMVKTKDGNSITFIDTPGHEAFTNMRKRGSLCTDIVILVVSAVDGCQPQTFEAIQHAKNAGVPIIVAVNKIDKGSNPEEVEKELFDYGLNVEPHGGNVPVIHISAKYKKNIDLLEELILFEAELLDLRAERDCPAEGVVLETKRTSDNETKACTVIIQKGTLKIGDYVVAGTQYGRIKAMKDDRGNYLTEAPPSTAVEIIGLKDLPENGDMMVVISDVDKAKTIAAKRKENQEAFEKKNSQETIITGSKLKFNTRKERRLFHSGSKDFIKEKMTELENQMLEKIEKLKEKEDEDVSEDLLKLEQELESHQVYVKEMIDEGGDDGVINVIVKAQDKGTLETLLDQINKVALKHEGNVQILDSSVGNVTESDLTDAKNFNAIILGMDISCPPEIAKAAITEKIQVKLYKIIYDVLDELKSIFKRGGIAKPEFLVQGKAVVKQIFEIKTSKASKDVKKVAGISVTTGQLTRKYKYRVIRNGKVVKENLDISSLKHLKSEVNELKKGKDGGLSLFAFEDLLEGDTIEGYELVKEEQK